jgi:xylulose-5-phosphate/fructose-6-phosphate phosphoketolase
VRGYKEEGNINTPLELAINNQIDRFNLVIDVIDRVPKLGSAAAHVKERMKNKSSSTSPMPTTHGTDPDEITHWQWPY